MADLKETDEEVEKAGKGMLPRGGSKRMLGSISARYRGGGMTAANVSRKDRLRRLHAGLRARTVRKSSDPLTTLYAEIEKARGKGLIRGGSKRLQRKMQGRAYGSQEWSWGTARGARAHRANKYLATRTGKDVGGATPARTYRGQGGLSPRQRIARFRTGKYK